MRERNEVVEFWCRLLLHSRKEMTMAGATNSLGFLHNGLRRSEEGPREPGGMSLKRRLPGPPTQH